jgi:hypothetical protein
MRFISTKAHGTMDYISGLLIIVSPWLFGFNDGSATQWTVVIIGVILMLSSILTNYETGIMKVMPMRVHLIMDIIAGVVLIVAPWLFGFADRIVWPYIIFGLFEVIAGLTSKNTPYIQSSAFA